MNKFQILVVEDDSPIRNLIATTLKTHNYKRVSLSVQKANYAAEMYRKIGFDIARGNKEEWIMLWQEGKH